MRLQRGDHFERFLIKEPLGAGARGELYQATDERLARDVALRLFVGDEPAEMLVAAAKKAASLDHPNIAAMYDVGAVGDVKYAVRELVRGSTLRARLDAGVVPIATCAEWMRMIASALEAAHALGLTHGALVAGAVVVSDDAVKVLEFSHVAESVDPRGETVALEAALEPMRVDVRAWGALAEELLTATRERGERVDSLRAIANHARKSGEPGGFTSTSEVVAALAEVHDAATASGGGGRTSSRARVVFIAGACLLAALAVVKARRGAEVAPEPQKTAPTLASESRMSSNPQATGAYRAGLQAARDGALDAALASLDRAIAIDPSFAAARLRRVILAVATDPSVRPSYETAARLREDLSAHDRVLLDAYGPATLSIPDLHETEARLVAALAREPHDTDFAYNLAKVRLLAGDYAGVARACDSLLAEDRAFAGAFQLKGYALLTAGEIDGGVAALDACLAVSPVATSCLVHEVDVAVNEGRCSDAVAKARRLVALDPDQSDSYRSLALALQGSGESLDAVRVALEAVWARTPSADRARTELADRASLAILSGDFALAETSLAKVDASIVAEPSELAHYMVAEPRIQLAFERGRTKQVSDLASRYLNQHAAWTPMELLDTSALAINALYVAGAMSRAEHVSRLGKWALAERAHPSHGRAFSPTRRWVAGFAAGVRTEEDARDALTELPPTLPGPNARDLTIDEAIGRVQLTAGHVREALGFLRRAASSCGALTDPLPWVRAQYELGMALEASGDGAAACRQYGRVLVLWRPSESIAARASTERAQALHCPKN